MLGWHADKERFAVRLVRAAGSSLLIRRATNTHPKARPSMPEAEEMMCAAFDDAWTSTSWELGRADLQSRLVALYTYALSVSLLPAQTHVQNGLPSPSGVCSV